MNKIMQNDELRTHTEKDQIENLQKIKGESFDCKYNLYLSEVDQLNSIKEYLSENRDSVPPAVKNKLIS